MNRKKLSIAVLALALCIGLASATVLTYYGQIQVTTTVSQAVLVDGKEYSEMPITEEASVVGGESFCRPHWLQSQTSVPVQLQFATTYSPDGEGITTSYWKLDEPTESVAGEVDAVTPSTNEENKVKGWAHVDVSYDVNIGEVKLTFVQPRNFYACFEYRTDGNTSQMIDTENYNTDITDGLYPYVCLPTIGTETITLSADEYVEVRMVFGGETDERFDWTKFDVLGTKIPEGESFTLQPGERLDFYICYSFDPLIKAGTYTITSTVNLAS